MNFIYKEMKNICHWSSDFFLLLFQKIEWNNLYIME